MGHRQAGAEAHAILTDDGGARDALAAAVAAIDGRAPYRDAGDRAAAVLVELDDVIGEVRRVAETIEEDPERLAAVRQRRQLLRDLCRKYGDDIGEVMRFGADAARRLAELEGFEQRAAELDAARRDAVAAERAAAKAVGDARRAAAPRMAEAVTERLRVLAMAHADVAVEVGEHADDNPGDRVQFLLSANPGAPLLPLSKVASGGELARAMLALRLVLTDDSAPDAAATLVFDEVDAGIGGAAATAVGAALAEVAQRAPGARRHPPRPGGRPGDDAGGRQQARRRGGDDGDGGHHRRRRPRRRGGPHALRLGRRRRRPPPRPGTAHRLTKTPFLQLHRPL